MILRNDDDCVILFVNSGKDIKINQDLSLPIITEFDTRENFKDVLLASLYSQVEFLRSELIEKNHIIKSLLLFSATPINSEISGNESKADSEIAVHSAENINKSTDKYNKQ